MECKNGAARRSFCILLAIANSEKVPDQDNFQNCPDSVCDAFRLPHAALIFPAPRPEKRPRKKRKGETKLCGIFSLHCQFQTDVQPGKHTDKIVSRERIWGAAEKIFHPGGRDAEQSGGAGLGQAAVSDIIFYL